MKITLIGPVDHRTLEDEVRKAVPDSRVCAYMEYLTVRDNLTAEELAAVQAVVNSHVPPPAPVPSTITPAQLYVAARRVHGITRAQIDSTAAAIISGIADPGERADSQVLWDLTVVIDRQNPFLMVAAGMLGLAEADVDQVFRVGALI